MSFVKALSLGLLSAAAMSAITSASASAFLLKWHVNAAEAAGQKVTYERTAEFELTNGVKSVKCTKLTGNGTVKAAGADEAESMRFTGCTASAGKCTAESAGAVKGTILISSISTQLVEREPGGGGAKKLADEFKQNVAGKEFVTLEFDEAGAACPGYPKTKVKGQVAAEVTNLAGGEVELTFPNPELKGNTLEAFGGAARLTGKAKNTLLNGGVLEGL
jgi:hypothetical protein